MPLLFSVKQKTTQEFLNDIIDQLDVLLAEIITDENDFSRFDIVKTKLRELFIQLEKQRVEKAHYEHPMSNDKIDSILAEFISCSDQYLRQPATVVVRFLKILAEHMNEPLIVDLG